MKKHLLIIFSLLAGLFMASCSEDETPAGNPQIELVTQFQGSLLGDSLPFTVSVSDPDVDLSTLVVNLYLGDTEIATKTIRTKTNGQYSGKLYIPFYPDIPDGNATIEFILTNVSFTKTVKTFDVPLARPDFPYLMLVTATKTYPMKRVAKNLYEADEVFPAAELPAYIKAPAVGENGNEITFGWKGTAVGAGITDDIPFAASESGRYTVSFNTLTFAAAPFLQILMNDILMGRVKDQVFAADADLTNGQTLEFTGFDFSGFWVDPDWFTQDDPSDPTKLKFSQAISGKYRITADFALRYYKVEVLAGSDVATLNTDGTGAVWAIGDNLGKPSYTANYVGWNTDQAICLVPVESKKYRLTLVGGDQVETEGINFKFFHQKGWGGEFTNETLSSSGDLVFVGNGTLTDYLGNVRDPGNLGLLKALTPAATYVFTVDLTAGSTAGILTVQEK